MAEKYYILPECVHLWALLHEMSDDCCIWTIPDCYQRSAHPFISYRLSHAGSHPGWVVTSSQVWHKETNNHSYSHSHLRAPWSEQLKKKIRLKETQVQRTTYKNLWENCVLNYMYDSADAIQWSFLCDFNYLKQLMCDIIARNEPVILKRLKKKQG